MLPLNFTNKGKTTEKYGFFREIYWLNKSSIAEKIYNLKLHIYIVYFGTGIILITFFVALTLRRKEKSQYFRYILVFVILGLIISLNTILRERFKLYSLKISISVENLLTLCQGVMLSLFLIAQMKNSKFKLLIKFLFFLSILIEFSLIIFQIAKNYIFYPRLATYLCLIVLCTFYFHDLLNRRPTAILSKSPAFWIIIGIFFNCCVSFPIYSLIPFLVKYTEFRNIKLQIFAISNMSLIVMYFFIIKSYLCLKHPQNSLYSS